MYKPISCAYLEWFDKIDWNISKWNLNIISVVNKIIVISQKLVKKLNKTDDVHIFTMQYEN